MKLKTIHLTLDTERTQAVYFFHKMFGSATDVAYLRAIEVANDDLIELVPPSDEHILSRWVRDCPREAKAFVDDYVDTYKTAVAEFSTGLEYLLSLGDDHMLESAFEDSGFTAYRDEYVEALYPMTSYRFQMDCPDRDYADLLDDCGVTLFFVPSTGDYFVAPQTQGTSWYDAHWIPLFKDLGWIEYEASEDGDADTDDQARSVAGSVQRGVSGDQ